MRAAKLVDIQKLEVVEMESPKITKDNEVKVAVKAVGICGTDLHIFHDGRADVQFPRIMGHELSGLVTEVGSAVTNVKVGDHVVLDPVFACNECKICKDGHQNVCDNVKCYGVQMDGGYCDEIVVEDYHLYSYDPKITYEQAALAEPFSIGVNIIKRGMVTAADKMVIIGCGTIGLCILQAAKGMGAQVLISDVVDEKLAKAKEMGADVIVNSKNENLKEAVEKFAKGGADIVVDAVGVTPLTQQSIDLVCPTGRIVVIGFDAKPMEIPPVTVTKKELTIVGSRMNCHQFPTVMEWLNEGKINSDLMVSRTYSVDDIQKAFEETLANGKDIVKTVITF